MDAAAPWPDREHAGRLSGRSLWGSSKRLATIRAPTPPKHCAPSSWSGRGLTGSGACQEHRRRRPCVPPFSRRHRAVPAGYGARHSRVRFLAALIGSAIPRPGRRRAGDRLVRRPRPRVAGQGRDPASRPARVARERSRGTGIRRHRLGQRPDRRMREGPSPGVAPTSAGGGGRHPALPARKPAALAGARGVHHGRGAVSSADPRVRDPHRAERAAPGWGQGADQWRPRAAALGRHRHAPVTAHRWPASARSCAIALPARRLTTPRWTSASCRRSRSRGRRCRHADRPRRTLHRLRQTLGFKLRDASRQLRAFAGFAAAQRRHPRPRVHGRGLGGGSSLAACPAHSTAGRRPPRALPARRGPGPRGSAVESVSSPRRSGRCPYIYAPEEVAQIVEAAGRLRRAYPLRCQVYATLLGLIAATGLRVSEALDLRLSDVLPDGVLHIRQTKFGKSSPRSLAPHGRAAL